MTGNRKKVRSLFLATLMVLSVVAPMIAFSGAAAAANESIDLSQDTDPTERTNNEYDTVLTSSGGPYWQGQRLAIEVRPDVTSNNVVQIREVQSRDGGGQRVGSLVKEVSLNSDDEAIVDTEDLEGAYAITTGAAEGDVLNFENGLTASGNNFDNTGVYNTGTPYDAVSEASFEVTAQNLNAGFQSDESAQEEIYLEISSARAGSDLLVQADGLDDGEIVDIFNDEFLDGDDNGDVDEIYDATNTSTKNGNSNSLAASSNGDGVVFEGVDSDANITANFSDVDTGDYEFEFEVTDTGVSDTSTVTVTEEDDVDATILRGGVATAAQGDFAVIPIQLEETDTAVVNVGFNDVNFNATFEVEDGNNDGLVTVEFNSFLAGRNDAFASTFLSSLTEAGDTQGSDSLANESLAAALTVAEDQDSVTVTPDNGGDMYGMRPLGSPGGAGIDSPMDPDQYDVNVTKNGNELDVGTIQIVQPQVTGINSWTMPGSEFDSVDEDEPAELYEYVENGQLTQSNSVAEGDVLVYQVQSTSMFGYLKAVEDSTNDYTTALDTIAGTGAISSGNYVGPYRFSVEQTDDTTRPNTDPKQVDLLQSSSGIKVVPDERNSSMFVVMNERDIQLDRSAPDNSGASKEMVDGETYEANWTIYEDKSGLGDQDYTVTDEASIVKKSIDFDTDAGGVIRVAASAGQQISGSTSVAPGTELNIRLRSTGDTPFLEDPTAIVDTDGTFNTTVDLSDRAQNASFSANAQGFDDDYDTPGVIGEAATASVTFDDQTVQNGMVSVEATLSEGGFVAIHSGSADGEVVGTSDYLENGSQTADVEIDPLSSETQLYAVAHMDSNDNQAFDAGSDSTYTTSNGTAVSDDAMVSPEQTGTPGTGTDTGTDTGTTDDTQTESQDTATDAPATKEPTTTDEDGPGFTAVLALVALVAAALLAVRRRD